jgi:L-fuculose-phosphate aldolase
MGLIVATLIALKLKKAALSLKASEREEIIEEINNEEVFKIKELVCDSGKKLQSTGLVSGTWGNVSCRVNSSYMIITPSGKDYSLLTPQDMVLVKVDDLSYQGNLKPSGESELHTEIYKNRKDVNAIIHTHSDNACTVAASRREVPPLLDDMVQILGPSIRVANYGVSGSKKLAVEARRAMSGRNGVLLANHGAVCAGRNMKEAFVACEIMEKACRTFIESEFLGGGVPIGKVHAKLMHDYFLKKYSKQ